MAAMPIADTTKPVRICIGDQIFETTIATLTSAGRGSLLARSAIAAATNGHDAASPPPIFFDRDPASFRILLNLLRTRRLPSSSSSSSFDLNLCRDQLIEEASFYGLLRILKDAMAPASLNGIDLERTSNLLPTGRDQVSALSASSDGSVFISHGCKITAFDWAFRRNKTTVTEFNTIQSLHQISDSHVACGSAELSGIHIYDALKGVHARSLAPQPILSPSACVRAISSNATMLFASFEDEGAQENAIVLFDRVTLQVAGEIGKQNGDSPHSKVATKLQWLPKHNWLFTMGVHYDGTLGKRGYVRIWDTRKNGDCVWEWKEPDVYNGDTTLDCFGDVAVEEEVDGMFKISAETGRLAMADMRHLRAEDPWMKLSESNPRMAAMEKNEEAKLVCHNKQIFCSRGGDLEVWSLVNSEAEKKDEEDDDDDEEEREYWETSFRRNFVEQKRYGSQDISLLEASGQRLFVGRRGMQGVEVWETKKHAHLLYSSVGS